MNKLIIPLMLTTALTGCASSSSGPSFGAQLAARGDQAAAIAKQWDKGSADVAKGEKLLAKGQELVEDGKKDQQKGEKLVEQGRKLIENGKQQMADSEAAYQTMRASPVQVPPAQ